MGSGRKGIRNGSIVVLNKDLGSVADEVGILLLGCRGMNHVRPYHNNSSYTRSFVRRVLLVSWEHVLILADGSSGFMKQHKLISDYAASQILGVVATVNESGNPEAALVAVTDVGDLELVFGTFNTARKYANLMSNPQVAITLGNSVDEAITIQYEGIAQELSGAELERCRELHIQKNPHSKKFATKPEQRWFKVKPRWIRYSDLGSRSPVVFELRP